MDTNLPQTHNLLEQKLCMIVLLQRFAVSQRLAHLNTKAEMQEIYSMNYFMTDNGTLRSAL